MPVQASALGLVVFKIIFFPVKPKPVFNIRMIPVECARIMFKVYFTDGRIGLV